MMYNARGLLRRGLTILFEAALAFPALGFVSWIWDRSKIDDHPQSFMKVVPPAAGQDRGQIKGTMVTVTTPQRILSGNPT